MFTPPMDFDIFNENQMLRYKGFSLHINLVQFYKSVPISLNNYSLTFLQQLSLPFLRVLTCYRSCDICHANVQYYSRTNFAPLHYGL